MFTLKTGLLVQGVTKLAFHTEGLDTKTVDHLKSGPVWANAAQYVLFPVGGPVERQELTEPL